MGYRSDITVVIYGSECNAEKYEALRVLMPTTFAEAYGMWDGCAEWDTLHKTLIFRIEDVKWYETYPEVTAFTKMLETLTDELDYNYEMVRLGENYEDIEQTFGGSDVDYILCVQRSVDINF